MDIVLIANGTRTLVNIIIIDLTHADFASQIAFSQGVAIMIVIQAKVVSYHDQDPEDDFIPLRVGEQLVSSMCQHGMINKGLWRSSSFDYTFIL
jgi:hypothetical protein